MDPTVCAHCGLEACEGHVPERTTDKRPRFHRALDIINRPRPIEIIEGLVVSGGVTVLVGESGTGKSFVMGGAGAAVSDGCTWHGRRVTAGASALLAFEGDDVGLRLRAVHETQGSRLEHFHVLEQLPPLSPLQTREGELPSIGERQAIDALTELRDTSAVPVRLLLIDTVRASMSGNEDNSEAVAAYLRAIRR